MCIVFLALGPAAHQAGHRLILASNRDEFLARATHKAHAWPVPTSPGHIAVCGVDLERSDHGTWLGVTSTGRFAAVTNFREPQAVALQRFGKSSLREFRSRGRLVNDFLRGAMRPETYLRNVAKEAYEWLGFTLIVGTVGDDGARVFVLSNRPDVRWGRLPDGVWGISNGKLHTFPVPDEESDEDSVDEVGVPQEIVDDEDVPQWLKVQRGEEYLADLLREHAVVDGDDASDPTAAGVPDEDEKDAVTPTSAPSACTAEERTDQLVERLWHLLRDSTRAPEDALPATGMPLHVEHVLSSIFIEPTLQFGPSLYGTRSSTVILVSNSGHVRYQEREYLPPHMSATIMTADLVVTSAAAPAMTPTDAAVDVGEPLRPVDPADPKYEWLALTRDEDEEEQLVEWRWRMARVDE
ncbi:hypothetical protein GGF31_005517 [Allomyces arbusculus]|nr:hypothetical protein GGF31_005517 [Allomyces arbusculus]